MRRWHWLFVCCFTIGCGSAEPFDYVPISGRIMYEDGTQIPSNGMRLMFVAQDVPQTQNLSPRPALANVNAEGEFDCVTSHKYGDGLIPGRHKVVIQADPVREGRPIFPRACLSVTSTPLVIDTADAPLSIKVPKP